MKIADQVINILDIVLLANIVLQSDNSYSCIADLNQDGSINILDVVLLANCILTDTCIEF